jgi:putative membrane protein
MKDGAVLNKLARHRTVLANERTLLAYARTAIMLAVSGITLIKFFGDGLYLMIIGITLLPVSFALMGFGFWRYRVMCKRIAKTDPESDSDNCHEEQ